MKLVHGILLSAGLALGLSSFHCVQAAPVKPVPLPAFNIDLTQTSVSGLSSGAYMAVQMQVAYSASINGAGVVAGGPYHCMSPVDNLDPTFKALDVMQRAADCMMVKNLKTPLPFWTLKGKTPPDVTELVTAAIVAQKRRLIDPLENLKNRKIYIFGGTRDETVGLQAVAAAKDFFVKAGANEKDNIRFVNDMAAGHAFITPNYGNDCAVASQPPYISKCGYDQAGQILRHIYSEPKPVDAQYAGKRGRLVAFSQVPFAKAATDRAMESSALDISYLAGTGYLYVPPACDANESCKVHVVFHGCHQGAEMDKDNNFILHTGYNEWAEKYNVVLLYPQASMGPSKNPRYSSNPNGCWDWFGYTNGNYAYKNGYQMKAVKGMIDALAKSNL